MLGRQRAYTSSVTSNLLQEAQRLNPRDRLDLIAALWDTLSEGDIPVTTEDRALLDARVADLEANPGDQSPWPEVKARLEQRQPLAYDSQMYDGRQQYGALIGRSL